MTTIACDGKSMAGDGMAADQCQTIVAMNRPKVFRLDDGRLIGAAGNSFDIESWRAWLSTGKNGDCPIQEEQFAALILAPSGSLLWVDHKGRELEVSAPAAVGSGQDFAIGAMEAGQDAESAVTIAAKRDPHTGGKIVALSLAELRSVA